jgi:hypothetical protein
MIPSSVPLGSNSTAFVDGNFAPRKSGNEIETALRTSNVGWAAWFIFGISKLLFKLKAYRMPYASHGSHGSQCVIVLNGFQWFYITQLIGFRTQVPKHMNVPLEHRWIMRHHSMISLRFSKSLSYLVLIFLLWRFCKFPASCGNQDSLKIGTKWSMYWFFWWLKKA